ncbi:hypothetical protein [Kaistia sp. UC242_56]|uniref:hypothetical protein n=1 Tax=Kaistia sp. UC242_56 TaxID=3374625 RepID=UPI0037ADF552
MTTWHWNIRRLEEDGVTVRATVECVPGGPPPIALGRMEVAFEFPADTRPLTLEQLHAVVIDQACEFARRCLYHP